MTREETIKFLADKEHALRCALPFAKGDWFDETMKEIIALNMAIEALRQDKRPKGRWIETCMADVYQCSNCKKATKMDEFCDSDILRNFCPNCGADMRGEEK